jgi:hypothetical protein
MKSKREGLGLQEELKAASLNQRPLFCLRGDLPRRPFPRPSSTGQRKKNQVPQSEEDDPLQARREELESWPIT